MTRHIGSHVNHMIHVLLYIVAGEQYYSSTASKPSQYSTELAPGRHCAYPYEYGVPPVPPYEHKWVVLKFVFADR